jgi:hypothetical protein
MHASARAYVIAGAALLTSSMIAVMPTVQPAALRVANMDVRLVDAGSSLTDVTDALGNLDPLTSLGSLDLPDLGSLDLGGLENIPYNLFADVANIPYYDSLALEEYAYALGPADTVGGVPGWIPPGATLDNGGVAVGDLYALGGTGSWYMESIGNTWGWDDGNWPQLDALLHFALPFSFTESLAEQIQIFAQAELIDGAAVNCEFECANPLAYLGGWLHGDTPLLSLLDGTTFPTILEDSVGGTGVPGDIVNIVDPQVTVDGVTGTGVIWSGEPAQLNPLAPLDAIATNLTDSPSADPIQSPDFGSVSTSLTSLFSDFSNDFSPFATGSFLFWGAPTLYSIPAGFGGTIQDLTGIPNQFINPDINPVPDIGWQPLGAEPLTGYADGPSSLLTGLPVGFEYLGQGLLGYLNPEIYLQALDNDFGLLTNPTELLDGIPLLGYLFDPSTLGLGPFDLSAMLGSVDPSTLLGSFDPTALLGSFDPTALLGSFDPTALLGSFDPTALTADLSSILPSTASLIPELGLQLLTAAF